PRFARSLGVQDSERRVRQQALLLHGRKRVMLLRGARALEPWWGTLLAIGYVGWLLTTTGSLGYARDEGFYFYAAERYQTWFELLLLDPGRALAPAVVDYHWAVNREHPAFIKTLLALSHGLFFERFGLFTEAG